MPGRPRKKPPVADNVVEVVDKMEPSPTLSRSAQPSDEQKPDVVDPVAENIAAGLDPYAHCKPFKENLDGPALEAPIVEQQPATTHTLAGFLPGMAPESHPELDDLATTYEIRKTDRVRLSNLEKEAKNALLDKMIMLGKMRYKTPDGIVVIRSEKYNVKTEHDSGKPMGRSVPNAINPPVDQGDIPGHDVDALDEDGDDE